MTKNLIFIENANQVDSIEQYVSKDSIVIAMHPSAGTELSLRGIKFENTTSFFGIDGHTETLEHSKLIVEGLRPFLKQISADEIADANAKLPAMYETYAAMESGTMSKGRGDNTGKNKFDKLKINIANLERIASITSSVERNELQQQAAAGPYEGAFVAKTPEQMLKMNQLIAARQTKELMLEMKADNAKQNKFNTYTSQDQRTSTQINNANYVNSMSARNDFWQEYYMHKAAAN